MPFAGPSAPGNVMQRWSIAIGERVAPVCRRLVRIHLPEPGDFIPGVIEQVEVRVNLPE